MILVIVKGKDGVEYYEFMDDEHLIANDFRYRIERYAGKDREVVLLQAPTIEDMRRTHGRFFKKE